MVYFKFLLISALFAFVATTEVRQCPGKSFEGLSENIEIESCSRPPCRLVEGTTPEFTITFTPETDLQDLVTRVSAYKAGFNFPFLGVDGRSACDKLETDDDDSTSCPLKAGTTYIYKNSFKIESLYPKGEYDVTWSLTSGEQDVICFKVKVNIV